MTAPTQMLESSMISEDTSETVSRTSNFEVAGAAMTGLLESVQVSAKSALHGPALHPLPMDLRPLACWRRLLRRPRAF